MNRDENPFLSEGTVVHLGQCCYDGLARAVSPTLRSPLFFFTNVSTLTPLSPGEVGKHSFEMLEDMRETKIDLP